VPREGISTETEFGMRDKRTQDIKEVGIRKEERRSIDKLKGLRADGQFRGERDVRERPGVRRCNYGRSGG
jgi:hypothetical protein